MKKNLFAIALITSMTMGLAACGSTSAKTETEAKAETEAAEEKGQITIGSKGFTENLILSELYALALEDAGYDVVRTFEVQNAIINEALIEGEIDLYPEYTGTALMTILQQPMASDPQEVYDTVKSMYASEYNLAVLDMTEASDGEGLVMLAETAGQYNIKTISDLWANASELRFGSTSDFYEREDGMVGLKNVYGDVNFKEENSFDNALKYQVLESKETDVVPAYTTDAQLANEAFLLLEDDLGLWPPYNIIPVTRQDVLEANPEIEEIINSISKTIDGETMQALNARVDIDLEEYEDVAADYYSTIKGN